MTKRAGLVALAALMLLAGGLIGGPVRADGVFVVFENPAAGALAVQGAVLDEEMAKRGALEVASIDFGIENSLVLDPRGATGPGRATLLPLRMTLPLGPGVPALLQTAGAGGHYGDASVHFRTSGRQPKEYATLSLKLVAVTGVEVATGGGGPPQATISLTYGAMKLDVYAQDTKGEISSTPETGSWNAMTGSADFATTAR